MAGEVGKTYELGGLPRTIYVIILRRLLASETCGALFLYDRCISLCLLDVRNVLTY